MWGQICGSWLHKICSCHWSLQSCRMAWSKWSWSANYLIARKAWFCLSNHCDAHGRHGEKTMWNGLCRKAGTNPRQTSCCPNHLEKVMHRSNPTHAYLNNKLIHRSPQIYPMLGVFAWKDKFLNYARTKAIRPKMKQSVQALGQLHIRCQKPRNCKISCLKAGIFWTNGFVSWTKILFSKTKDLKNTPQSFV